MGKKHHKTANRVPIVSIAIVAGQAVAAWTTGGGTFAGALDNFQSYYTGYDFTERALHLERLIGGYVPWIVKRYAGRIAQPGRNVSRFVPGVSFS